MPVRIPLLVHCMRVSKLGRVFCRFTFPRDLSGRSTIHRRVSAVRHFFVIPTRDSTNACAVVGANSRTFYSGNNLLFRRDFRDLFRVKVQVRSYRFPRQTRGPLIQGDVDRLIHFEHSQKDGVGDPAVFDAMTRLDGCEFLLYEGDFRTTPRNFLLQSPLCPAFELRRSDRPGLPRRLLVDLGLFKLFHNLFFSCSPPSCTPHDQVGMTSDNSPSGCRPSRQQADIRLTIK